MTDELLRSPDFGSYVRAIKSRSLKCCLLHLGLLPYLSQTIDMIGHNRVHETFLAALLLLIIIIA